MAFLCPARKQRKRSKVKIRGSKPLDVPLMGRITGSDSIDTIDRVAIEKERGNHARMVILHDFEPCVDDELRVERGEEVSVLYQENDWLYVITEGGQEGFIPYTYGLPVQRSVDDFVTPTHSENPSRTGSHVNVPKQRPSSAHVSTSYGSNTKETKPAYQFATINKPQHILNRSSSKSLPDLNGPSAPKPVTGDSQRYPTDHISHPSNQSAWKQPPDEAIKDLTYGMSRDYSDVKAAVRPRSLSYDTQERRRAQYNTSVTGTHSQPTTPVRTTKHLHNRYSLGTDYLSKSEPVSTSHQGPTYTASSHTSGAVNPRAEEDRDYVDSLRRRDREEEKRRPLHQSWGSSNSHKLSQLLMNSRKSQVNQSAQHATRQNHVSTNLLQIQPRALSEGNTTHLSSFLTATNRNRTPLSSSSLFREESAKLSASSVSNNIHADSSINRRGSNNTISKPRIEKFSKTTHGEYLVIYKFSAQQEDDLTVERGEFVTVLNTEDKDWYWVRRSDHKEGFVPSNYLLNVHDQIHNSPATNGGGHTGVSHLQSPSNPHYTTARQPQWSAQQPKPSQPLPTSNYHPATTTQRPVSFHNQTPSFLSNNQQPLNATIYHSTSVANTKNTTANTQPRNPQVTTGSHRQNGIVPNTSRLTPAVISPQNATATSSPREPLRQSSFQQQLSPISVPTNLSPGIPIGSTRLICLYDYQAMTPEDLTVSRGQWLYADSSQEDPDWLWVYSPSQSRAGYIPRTYAKPPSSW